MKKKEALVLAETKWWEHATDDEIVRFQLFEPRLCMPPEEFQRATEEVLGREIFAVEFWHGTDGLKAEYLEEKGPPTMEEISELVPEKKRKIIFTRVDANDLEEEYEDEDELEEEYEEDE